MVSVREARATLGGAANVAANVTAIGSGCRLVGLVGDVNGEAICTELASRQLDDKGLLTIAGRPTITKTRMVARGQQIVRIDEEVDTLVDGAALEARSMLTLPMSGCLVFQKSLYGISQILSTMMLYILVSNYVYNNDFETQLKIAEHYEDVLDNFFHRRFDIFPVSDAAQRMGIDRIWVDKKTKQRWSVEYKSDKLADVTGNVFIETVSRDTSGVCGWVHTSIAQIVVYYVPGLSKAYCIYMTKLRELIRIWEGRYKTGSANNGSFSSVGVLVPIVVFGSVCFFCEDHTGD